MSGSSSWSDSHSVQGSVSLPLRDNLKGRSGRRGISSSSSVLGVNTPSGEKVLVVCYYIPFRSFDKTFRVFDKTFRVFYTSDQGLKLESETRKYLSTG